MNSWASMALKLELPPRVFFSTSTTGSWRPPTSMPPMYGGHTLYASTESLTLPVNYNVTNINTVTTVMFTTLRVPLLPGGRVQSWNWSGQLMCVYTSMTHCNIQFHRIPVALKMTKMSTSVCTHFIKTHKYRSSTITMQVFVDLNWLANDNWKSLLKCINDLRSHWQKNSTKCW